MMHMPTTQNELTPREQLEAAHRSCCGLLHAARRIAQGLKDAREAHESLKRCDRDPFGRRLAEAIMELEEAIPPASIELYRVRMYFEAARSADCQVNSEPARTYHHHAMYVVQEFAERLERVPQILAFCREENPEMSPDFGLLWTRANLPLLAEACYLHHARLLNAVIGHPLPEPTFFYQLEQEGAAAALLATKGAGEEEWSTCRPAAEWARELGYKHVNSVTNHMHRLQKSGAARKGPRGQWQIRRSQEPQGAHAR
jgi:hypothetical protein